MLREKDRAEGCRVRLPLCFVLMPFSQTGLTTKTREMDFDSVYERLIAPAVAAARMRPHRADEETLGGIFHKRMFERLALCEYAVADLSMANPNVFYELGVRHAIRPWSTVLMFRDDAPLPLDVAESHALKYSLDVLDRPRELEHLRHQLTTRLVRAQQRETDSPVHMLVNGLPVPEVDHRRVELMLEAIDREAAVAGRIRRAGQGWIRGPPCRLRRDLEPIDRLDSESAVALLLAFRSRKGWQEMVDLVGDMTPELAEVVLVREQHALALARIGRFDEAAELLEEIVARRPNAETYGLLGGVRKREWLAAGEAGKSAAYRRGLLRRAISTYRQGFDLDLRDTYPGINALTLMAEARDAAGVASLAPVVRYSVERRLENPETDYWDHACAVELALIEGNIDDAESAFPSLLDKRPDEFQASTTSATLRRLADLSSDSEVRELGHRLADELTALAEES